MLKPTFLRGDKRIGFDIRTLSLTVVVLALILGENFCGAASVTAPASGLSVNVDEVTGNYTVTLKSPAWTFGGSLNRSLKNTAVNRDTDSVGAYQQIAFEWNSGQTPMTGRICVYDERALVLFSDTCGTAVEMPPEPFPSFTALPTNLFVFSHSQHEFAPPQFAANEISTPWMLFDDKANALVISPASHYFVASMLGDGRQRVASGFNKQLRNLPAGFTQQTVLAFGKGINRAWDLWGQALIGWQGVKRPGNDADTMLKYLGYWTDNGATYYYNYDRDKGYAGTLRSLVEHYRQEQIPLRYLQLDSWWYSKSMTGPEGKVGQTKNAKLPEGEWNRYGGLWEYKAHKSLFPDGLAAYQKSIGLPLVTHNRWVDLASPYREKYEISGVAAIDPKWWDEIAAYLKASGVITYEQDWLDRIYTYSPAFSSNVNTGEAFLDNMARACKQNGLTMQYCMPYACYFLQGSRYENLTTIRTATDRFSPPRWNNFLYTSRLATSMGIWPWADVFNSTDTDDLLLCTLSAGPVGVGDAIGRESKTNLFRAVRADGVIVKPDVPIMPLDQSYIADARQTDSPLIASTYTDHDGVKTAYVFAFTRPKAPAGELRFSPGELGLTGPVYVYDYFAGTSRRMESNATFSAKLGKGATAFYVVAPVGKSGIALLGDNGKFVSTGKQRIASLQDERDKLTLKVVFAEVEKSVQLHGYAATAPKATAQSGWVGLVQYEASTQHFTVELKPNAALPIDLSTGDPVRQMTVTLEVATKWEARR